MQNIKLIPFSCSAGGQVKGSERAGIDLKQAGFVEGLKALGLPAEWLIDPEELYNQELSAPAHENLPALGTAERKDIVLHHCAQIQSHVLKALEGGALPFTLGGDHAMALGSISAVAKHKNAHGKTGVIWIDAHPDLNTPETSPSQAIHGMPLAALVGMGHEDYVSLAGNKPVISPEHIVYIAIRDIDPGEQAYIDKFGITAFTMEDVDRLGIEEVMERAKAVISKGTQAKVISIDLDGFDPEDVPSVGSPAPNGLKPEATLPVLADLVRDVDFDLIEIAEYNPTLAGRDQTFAFIKELSGTLLPLELYVRAA